MSAARTRPYFPLYMETPGKRPNVWHDLEFKRLGMVVWPKEIGFFNAGDNFELTPEAMYRIFKKNADERYWTPNHNEKTIIHMLPLVEKDPKAAMARVLEVFQHHVKRFGADHCIYNAVMQAYAFAKDLEKCKSLFEEMKVVGLDPNTQTFVNLMLASKLAGEPRDKVEEWFTLGVKSEALVPVVRLDTEFQMWWDQFERLGSFTKNGMLSVNEEGASPKPTDMWATWGWDRRLERKFVSREEYVRSEITRRIGVGRGLYGTVFSNVKRRPWSVYKGLLRHDWIGPQSKPARDFADAPYPEHNNATVGTSY